MASTSSSRGVVAVSFAAAALLLTNTACTNWQITENYPTPYPDATPGVQPARPLASSVARTLGANTNSLGMTCSVTGTVTSGSVDTLMEQMVHPLADAPARGAPTVVRDFLAVCMPPASQPPLLGNINLPTVTLPATTYGARPRVAFDATGGSTQGVVLNATPMRDDNSGVDCDVKLPNVYTGRTGPSARIMGMTVPPLEGYSISALPVVSTVQAGVVEAKTVFSPKVECRSVRGVFSQRPTYHTVPF